MEITPLAADNPQLINAYGEGGFRISGRSYRGSVLVLPTQTLQLDARTAAELAGHHLEPVAAFSPGIELLLAGCGAEIALFDDSVFGALKSGGVAVEAMNTGAACRTFNVLLAEDRRVAAVLIAVD